MTFVIIVGGIDLSVGSVMGLASVVATLSWVRRQPTNPLAAHGAVAGRRRGPPASSTASSSRARQSRAVHGHLGHARRRPRPRRDPRERGTTQIVRIRLFIEFFRGLHRRRHAHLDLRHRCRAGWSCSTAPPSAAAPIAIGGTARPPASPASGKRHTIVASTRSSGLSAGIAAVMILGRTTAGTSTHGTLYELDAIAAVVVGGTLLVGGRGTITAPCSACSSSPPSPTCSPEQPLHVGPAVVKGIIIVIAVLLQQRFAKGSNRVRAP